MTTPGQQHTSVRWDLLDSHHNKVGELHPDRKQAPTIANSTEQGIKRTLQGLRLLPDEQATLDVFAHRIRPVWLAADGTATPWGVFLVGDASRSRSTRGLELEASCVDYCYVLDQPAGMAGSYGVGANVGAALTIEFAAAGIPDFTIDPTPVVVGGTGLQWSADVTRLQRMTDLCRLAGYLDPYFDNVGRGRCRLAPAVDSTVTTLIYRADTTISRYSQVESDDLLACPNRYVVVGTDGTDTDVRGEWNVPDSAPYSYARRGILVTKVLNVQGLVDNAQAAQVAQAEAAKDGAGYLFAEFSTLISPAHDTYDVVAYMDTNYLELGWSAELTPGGEHKHSLRRVWSA